MNTPVKTPQDNAPVSAKPATPEPAAKPAVSSTPAAKPVAKKAAPKKAAAPKKKVAAKTATPKKVVAKKPAVKKVAAPKKKTVTKKVAPKVAASSLATPSVLKSMPMAVDMNFGFGKENIEKVMKSGAMISKSFENIGKFMMDSAKQQLDESVQVGQKMMACKTIDELAKVQKSYFENTMKRAVEQGKMISKLSSEAGLPIGEQFTTLMQSLTKAITKK